MTADDIDEFFVLLDEVYDLMGKTPAAKVISASGKSLFFKALMPFTLEQVQAALDAHVQEGTFTPVPSDIKAQIERHTGGMWINADEAWARIPKPGGVGSFKRLNDRGVEVTCRDYSGTEWPAALLNQVTTEALAVAGPLLEDGEENAARMAFRACYNRRVEEEKAAGRPPKYRVAGGTHEEQQVLLASAVEQGLLPAPETPLLLGETPTAAEYVKFKLALAELKMKSLPPPEAE